MGEDDEWIYMVLEWAGGGDLYSFVSSRPVVGEPAMCRVLHQVLQGTPRRRTGADRGVFELAPPWRALLNAGVAYMHSRGVAHFDLSLENVLLVAGAAPPPPEMSIAEALLRGHWVAKIADFGQARCMEPAAAPSGGPHASLFAPWGSGQWIGHEAYFAPEVRALCRARAPLPAADGGACRRWRTSARFTGTRSTCGAAVC